MPADKVVRFSDYEKRSRHPDSEHPRDPADADVIEFTPKRHHTDPVEWEPCGFMQKPCDC